MEKNLKMLLSASLVGAMLTLPACGGGGGGGGGDTTPPVPDGTQVISATHTTAAATANVDTFKLIDADLAGYTATISNGFDWKQDFISYPAGGAKPVAYPGGVNDNMTDGNVDLTWVSNGKEVTIHLTGLAADAELALTSSDPGAAATIYKTY